LGSMTFPASRPRRLRRTSAIRSLVAEARLTPNDLIAPLFVKEGLRSPEAVVSMPGVSQHTVDSLAAAAKELAAAGVRALILFGVPERKDPVGSAADDGDGIVQVALRRLRDDLGDDVVLMADLCLDEYTDHGHCGVLLDDGTVDNDATLERYASIALAQADAGAAVVAPSGMMDGQVGTIRAALDGAGHADVAVMAYATKYASCFYGPFRDAAECAPRFGDRAAYQMDPANGREALREAALDEAEGADILMVKPAMSYLDVVAALRSQTELPVAAFQVSGEYAMIKAATARGWLDEDRLVMETLVSIKRAGADLILTYFAGDVAVRLS